MDDIVYEVLLRLPPRSVSRFRHVSPRWSRLIDTSFFRQNYAKRWLGDLNLLGFFVFNTHLLMYPGKRIYKDFRQLSSYWWPSISTCTTTTQKEVLKAPAEFLKGQEIGFFITTCNGLVLSGLPPNYYVCNPVSKQLYQLPKPPSHFPHYSIAFWCKDSDDNLSINFKVVCARITYAMHNGPYHNICMETFCSTTREWSQTTLRCSSKFQLQAYHVAVTVTRSGVICWRARDKKLAIHDINEETRHITLIQDPCSSIEFIHNSYEESSDGRLQYGECDLVGIKIMILDKLQWNLRYKISFSSMLTNNPTIYGCDEFYFLSLIPQNSESIYIRAGSDKFFLYHLSTGKMEPVLYSRGHSLKLDTQCQEASGYYHIEPYYERLWPDLSF